MSDEQVPPAWRPQRWTQEMVDEYAREHWPLIADHPEDCPCDARWEYIVITQK